MRILPKKVESEPQRIIELDADETMYFTIEFEGNSKALWKSLISQADKCFKLHSSEVIEGCDERLYLNSAGLGTLISCDENSETIVVQTRMPQSARAIDMFVQTVPMIPGCCERFAQIVKASIADKDLEDMFDPFRN
jgi:hypothetical protein